MKNPQVEKIWASTFVSHPYSKGDTWVPLQRAKAAVKIALDRTTITDEMVERAARAVEARQKQTQYGWSDELFEIWWDKDPDFIDRKHVWGFFEGTQKERCLWEARMTLEAAFKELK